MKLTFTVLASLFLAYDSGQFYGSGYDWHWVGFIISGLSYGAFTLMAYERRYWATRAVLTLFLIVNTLSATVGASGELLDQWEKTLAISHSAGAIDGLRGLALSQGSRGEKLNSAKNANAFRELTLKSVENYKPLAWVKIGLNLAVRVLLEFSILILAGGSRSSRMDKESKPKAAAPDSRTVNRKKQPQLKGIFLGEESLKVKISEMKREIAKSNGFKFGNGIYKGDDALGVLKEAEELLIKILKEKK